MSSIPWPFPRPKLWTALTSAASGRARRWARKRQGIDPRTTRLRPGRVYILLTGVGLVFALMTFAMLLGSMNYNNNLSFLLTFMLVGIGFVAMHQCQRNLSIRRPLAGPSTTAEPTCGCSRTARRGGLATS